MNLPSCIKKVDQALAEKEKEKVNQKEKDLTGSSPGSSKNQSTHLDDECQKSVSNVHEVLRVDDARMCKICYNEELGVVFLPCGHMVACVKCAPGMTTCAVCREPVTMTVRAFFS